MQTNQVQLINSVSTSMPKMKVIYTLDHAMSTAVVVREGVMKKNKNGRTTIKAVSVKQDLSADRSFAQWTK